MWKELTYFLFGSAQRQWSAGRHGTAVLDGLSGAALGLFGLLDYVGGHPTTQVAMNVPMCGVVQTGGATLNNRAAAELNQHFGTNVSRRDWGRALERLKRSLRIRGDHHGKLMSDGTYVHQHTGQELGNIADFPP